MPAPTLAGPKSAVQASSNAAPVPVIPFTRASRKKSRLVANIGPITLNTGQQALNPIQVPAAGFLRSLKVYVSVAAATNAATVAFQPDAPFNILQQISVLSANGDSLISPIDGFTLFAINKYMALGQDQFDAVADTGYSVTPGAVATGGSATFNTSIPFEVDTRDAFGAVQNMAANQSFLLQMSLNSIAQIYSTAPTNAPTVSITVVMDYWSAPAAANSNGDAQAIFPLANGSVSLIQTQTPPITPGAGQNIQQLNVGNTIRSVMYILRDSAGKRTEVDWPGVTNFYVNNDPWYYKTKNNWRSQMAKNYGYKGGITASPTAGALDNGVFVLTDFIDDGAGGNGRVSAGSNRNLWLVTGSATAFNVEATTPWGGAANSLLIVQNTIRPSSPQAVYAGQFI